ncbi:protein kinase C1 [Pholiota molesta]|nr:protein kinase C1 [Pholiota molesta]
MSQELDQKIAETWKHIQTERKILEATQLLRQATSNQDVLRRNEAKIRETERSLAYFEDTLGELQARKAQLIQRDDPSRFPGGTVPQVPPKQHDPSGGRYPGSPEMGYPGGRPSIGGPPRAKQYTNLDLIKADTPFTPKKISKMLHQLEFKHQVEMQYKKGIDKMAKLYQADGDKKSKADAESKRVESDKKIQLLESALKRYKNLHILDDVVEDDDNDATGNDGERKDKLRSKPLSGTLYVTVKGARELDHAPIVSGRSRSASKVVETHVSIKVEGTQLAKSHPSRTDRWNEDFEIPVDKANEVEIVVYDKQVSEPHAIPIGLLWIRVNDLVDALRRQKVPMDGQGGWVTAGAMPGDNHGGMAMQAPSGDMNAPLGYAGPPGGNVGTGFPGQGSEGIEAWFAVEPAGAIALQLNFVKENVRKRPLDGPLGGLGRQGAVRKRKGEVHEMNGHKFVQRQFYQLMLCAFCNDFLLNALGYQCEDCRYTCHKKCYEKVVTKCISKSNTGEGDEEKINHRIPHRFEPLTNIGANWCCHCGYMLPLGRKNARKCSECDITCHANCAHLVPDFCGMSMETANELLRNWRDINKARGDKDKARPAQRQYADQTHAASPSLDAGMGSAMDRMKIGGPEMGPPPLDSYGRPTSAPPAVDRYSQERPYQGMSPPQQQQQLPPQQQYARPPPGARPPVTPSQPMQDAMQGRMTSPYDVGPPPDLGYGPGSSGYQQPPRPQPQQLSPVLSKPTLPPTPQSRPMERPGPSPGPGPIATQPSQRFPPQQPPARQQTRKRKVGLDDFNFLAVLGKGNFGKVMLAEEKKTNGLYAIKVLKKEFIIDNDEVESTRSEKRVFLAAAKERHPFLLGLHSCFQTETRVYFVMEYVSGGDLMLHIQRKQFSLRQAKFYASEVLLALEYFHANGIIYRDLKLDNILLTLDGHVKVADYGLCKEDMWFGQTTSTFCGTPEFMAPEILLEQRYGRAVDWWAFGVLTYEMLLGQSPFRGDDEDEIFDAILEDEPLYPITMPRDAVSILQKLLTRDPARRLGSGKEDAEEIKRQPFFKDINFDDVLNKRIPPPYFPTINGSADTSNFDEEFTREQPTLTPVHGQLSSRDQSEFNGFSWVAGWADI